METTMLKQPQPLTREPDSGILLTRRRNFTPMNSVNALNHWRIPMDTATTTAQDTNNTTAPAPAADKFAGVQIPNPDPNHNSVEMRFGFRTIKDEKSGVETKRPEVNVKLPVLNFEGVRSILQNYAQAFSVVEAEPDNELAKANLLAATKEYDLLMSAVQSVYESKIKDFLGDNPAVTTQTFPYEQFTWNAIANEPESERRGRGIAKEIWDEFLKSYIAVMPAATGKTEANITKQAAILGQKLNPLKNHEDKDKILPKMKEQLAIYMNVAGNDAETFAPCVQFLMEKADKILNTEQQADLAANLGFD